MNHLAHLFLSQRDPSLMVGNFIADHIKTTKLSSFSEGVQDGILMHRAIDHFTDTHPIVRKSKERLFPKYSHYSAVLVDMFYDRYAQRVAASPDGHGMDYVHCYLICRKA